MIKLPVKDRTTIPWMTQREIPAIKAVLSAWRKLRRDKAEVQHIHDRADMSAEPDITAKGRMLDVAWELELLTALDERLRKEVQNGQA